MKPPLVTFIILKTSIPISSFQCPEPNGLFADPEQCDLYYICEDNVAQPELCEDGLLFDDSNRNRETCKLPHGVDCGKREFVQEPQAGIDPRCPRYLNHPKIFCGTKFLGITARTYLQLPLRQWGAGNVYLLVLSS